jgi:excisionase family DNA binding protein
MSQEFYTVERAAELLQLHPKTVLRLIREGRLRATKIGKSYRVLRSDLDTFAGGTSAASAPSSARVTCIADLPDLTRDEASRMASVLQACLIGQTARPDPIRLDTAYDLDRRHLKVVIIAAPADTAALLKTLDALLAAAR